MMTRDYLIYTDGGSVNSMYAACAFAITKSSGEILYKNSVSLGPLTNNCAECNGIIYALLSALAGGINKNVSVFSDSQLIINQINGIYQIKAPHLIPYHKTIKFLSGKFEDIIFTWVSREHPMISVCDKMCDEVIEGEYINGI